jgi:hypothetical protein
MTKMKWQCSADDIKDAWVDVSIRWTRKEVNEMLASTTAEEMVGWLRKKIIACHLPTTNPDVYLTDPQALTVEVLDEQVDLVLYDFLGSVMVQTISELRALGPLSGLRLSSTAGMTVAQKKQ